MARKWDEAPSSEGEALDFSGKPGGASASDTDAEPTRADLTQRSLLDAADKSEDEDDSEADGTSSLKYNGHKISILLSLCIVLVAPHRAGLRAFLEGVTDVVAHPKFLCEVG